MSGIIDLTSDDDENARRQPLVNDENGSDEEDEDLKLAIALSLQDQVATETSKDRSLASPVVDDTHQPAPSTATSTTAQGGLLGLDRRAMEAERLARLKRKREPEGDTRPLSQQPSTLSTRISPPPTKAQKSAPAKAATCPTSSSTKQSKAQPSFPTPQVLLTSDPSRHDPTNPSKYTSISFADIVKPPTPNLQLKSVLLSSFIADFDWILPHFNTRTTNFLLILHAQNAQHRALLESDFAGLPNVKLAMPSLMGGAGNMHSKIMLLFYADSNSSSGASAGSSDNREICRIVVPSANLTRADWGVGGVMENILTVVDLPLKSSTDVCVYRFEKKLKAQMAAMEVPESVLRKVERFDFAATGNVEFVYSMSGSNLLDVGAADTKITLGASQFFQREKGKLQITAEPNTPGDRLSSTNVAIDDPARTGLLSLNDAVVSAGLGVSTSDARDLPQVDFVTSSLGNLTTEFVRQLYLAICGQLNPAAVSTKSKRSSTNMASNDVTLDEHVLQNLKIYFPSSGTVHRSKGGPGAGGTICFQRKWWNSNELIRHCLHDCVGVRDDGILMHSKVRCCFLVSLNFRAPRIVRDVVPLIESCSRNDTGYVESVRHGPLAGRLSGVLAQCAFL